MVACNTASTLVLAQLREKFKVPFVGTVPAIKPACSCSSSKLVSVLGTEATVKREYTRKLIREHGNDCARDPGRLAPACRAGRGRAEGRDRQPTPISLAEIAPCFVEADGARTDTVVLACTHYPLLLDRLERLAPWPVNWIDPAPAIARRVVDLLGPAGARRRPLPARAVFTSGRRRRPRWPRRWPVSGSPKPLQPVFDTPGKYP